MQLNNLHQPAAMLILLVDDRPENCLVLEQILSGENRSFLHAHSGNDALRQVLKNPEIGLVMLDVQMPDIDGFEVARLLKGNPQTRELPIIFVTALSKEQHHVIRGFAEGAVDYLQKPLDIEVTQAKVKVFETLHQYQAALRTSLEHARHINTQLERFVHTVAHDIKSPLSGMVTMLSVLDENAHVHANKRVKDYVSVLSDAAGYVTQMVASILEYSSQSLEQQAAEEVDTTALVKETARLLFPPRYIRVQIQEEMPVIVTRKLKLQQVFQNLLSNAFKYCDKHSGLIQVGFAGDSNKFLEFFVTDNGPGIPEEEQNDLFTLFRKGSAVAHNGDTSTGVGLNILKVLVEEQGGRLRVESTPGCGATFFFEWAKEAGAV